MTCWNAASFGYTAEIQQEVSAEFDKETYKWRHLIESYFVN